MEMKKIKLTLRTLRPCLGDDIYRASFNVKM